MSLGVQSIAPINDVARTRDNGSLAIAALGKSPPWWGLTMLLQLLYISSTRPAGLTDADLTDILKASRWNNSRQDITGLLFFNGRRFLQALEGPAPQVTSIFERIQADHRHRGVVVLSSKTVASREFGSWAMASRFGELDNDEMLQTIAKGVEGAAPAIRATFENFASI